MKIVTPNLAKQFPRGNNLSSTYGRSNRISKLVAPVPTKAPLKNLDGFLGLNKEDAREEKPEQVEQISKPAPVQVVQEVKEEIQAPQILEAREEPPQLQHLNEHSQEYVIEKLKNLAQKTEQDDLQMDRDFYPRKLSSPANYEESNLSKEFEVEKQKEQFDIEEEDSHAAKIIDDAAEMMRKAAEHAKQTQNDHVVAMEAQSYSDDSEKSSENEDMSDQEEEPYQVPQQHVSRPTIGVKQPVSQSIRQQLQHNQGENELKKLQESLQAQKDQLAKDIEESQ